MSTAITVWTLWHGREVIGSGSLDLLDDEVLISVPAADAEMHVPFSALDGARVSDDHVTLFASTGDLVELDGQDLAGFGSDLRARACTLPELTLALRGLGSARAFPGPDHDRFFAPFLAARRAAQRASDAAGRLSALRAPALAAELKRVLHEFAVARFPNDPAERRALETRFEDESAAVRDALAALDDASRAALAASDDTAFVRWREWASACKAVFVQVDRCWLAVAPVLRATPIARAGGWHWPWRREGDTGPRTRHGA